MRSRHWRCHFCLEYDFPNVFGLPQHSFHVGRRDLRTHVSVSHGWADLVDDNAAAGTSNSPGPPTDRLAGLCFSGCHPPDCVA